MRIIAGKWKGIPLISPQGPQTRPILDRVKETAFNILGSRLAVPGQIPPGSVLDLFAGTGSMGIEALSRGALFCLFVEMHEPTLQRLRSNLERIAAGTTAKILGADVWNLRMEHLQSPHPFELVFVDPPYKDTCDFSQGTPIFDLMNRLPLVPQVASTALILLRHHKKTPCSDSTFPRLNHVDQRTIGDTSLSFFTPRRG